MKNIKNFSDKRNLYSFDDIVSGLPIKENFTTDELFKKGKLTKVGTLVFLAYGLMLWRVITKK